MVSKIDPRVDFAFKWLFGRQHNVPLLVHLLNAVLQPPPGAEIEDLELLNPFNEKDAQDDKLSIVDVKAHDKQGCQFDVEMQLLSDPAFRKRVLYYWARLHQQQLKEGDPYNKVFPTISVCLTDFALFPEVPDFYQRFQLRGQHSDLVFSSDIIVITLELTKFELKPDKILTPLDAWLYFLRNAEELDHTNLAPALNKPEIRKALEELEMLSQDDLERERYLARLRVLTDEKSRQESWREEGLDQGQLIGPIRAYQGLLKQVQTPVEQLRALPLEELLRQAEELKKMLEHKLRD